MEESSNFFTSLIAGGIAGTTVDVALFPLDTIKTRIQSSQGFIKSGGFRGVYKGLSAAALGSSPGAAIFFCTYDTMKMNLRQNTHLHPSIIHMASACVGEIAACSIRVPTEVIKQRMQVGRGSIFSVTQGVLQSQGISGFYSCYFITMMREIPFALIQFPLYEYLKLMSEDVFGRKPRSMEAGIYGAVAGGIAAGLTTPLDVCKTRLMLAESADGRPYHGVINTFSRIIRDEGASTLLRGIYPRMTWISIGGFVFFGAYEKSKSVINSIVR